MLYQINKNLGRITPQKLAVVVGGAKVLINPSLESHTSYMGFKSHTLLLDSSTHIMSMIVLDFDAVFFCYLNLVVLLILSATFFFWPAAL